MNTKLEGRTTRFIALNLLTETCVNVEKYGGQTEFLAPLTAVVYKCQADTDSTDGNGYGQPQDVAKRCDETVPFYAVVVGQTYKHVDAGRQSYSCYSIYLTVLLPFMFGCNDQMWKKFIGLITRTEIYLRFLWKYMAQVQ